MYTKELIEAKLKEEYPHGFNMYYVDYQDNFNNNPELMAELLDGNNGYGLDEICGFTDKPRDNELLLHTK